MTTEKAWEQFLSACGELPIQHQAKLGHVGRVLVDCETEQLRQRIAEMEGADAGRLVLELNRRASQVRELEEQLDVARLGFVKATKEALSARAELARLRAFVVTLPIPSALEAFDRAPAQAEPQDCGGGK